MTNKHHGTWQITEMGRWDSDCIDLIVPGYIRFDDRGIGEIQFGTVHGHLKYRVGGHEDNYRIAFGWDGAIESEPAKGTGWAEINQGGLQGHIYIQDSDDSWFKAERKISET